MTPKIWVSFQSMHTGACPGADRPAETHGGLFIEGSKPGILRGYFELKILD